MPGHVPVLLLEAVRLLITDPRGTYVDVTLGGCGHSVAILREVGMEARVVGMDCDPAAVERARRTPPALAPRFTAVRARFSEIESALEPLGIEQVDGILADLGISSTQLDDPIRGLSFDRLFVVGAGEKIFPRIASQDPILLDSERRWLADRAAFLPARRDARITGSHRCWRTAPASAAPRNRQSSPAVLRAV